MSKEGNNSFLSEKESVHLNLFGPLEVTGTILLDPPLPMPQGNNIVTVSFSDRQKKRRRRNLRRNMKRANGTKRKKSQRNEFVLIKDYKFLWDGNCKTREENGVLMGSLSMRRLGKSCS